MASDWRSEDLIHGDLKSGNCVVVLGRGGRGTGMRLVDWESAGLGDGAWDVGSVLGDYLSTWLGTIPITGVESPERLTNLARYPLDRLRPAVLGFWTSYAASARLTVHDADRLLLRAARYAGVRLLQTASERTQFETRLTGPVLCLTQVAMNILRRPGEAAVRLFGIPLRGGAA